MLAVLDINELVLLCKALILAFMVLAKSDIELVAAFRELTISLEALEALSDLAPDNVSPTVFPTLPATLPWSSSLFETFLNPPINPLPNCVVADIPFRIPIIANIGKIPLIVSVIDIKVLAKLNAPLAKLWNMSDCPISLIKAKNSSLTFTI